MARSAANTASCIDVFLPWRLIGNCFIAEKMRCESLRLKNVENAVRACLGQMTHLICHNPSVNVLKASSLVSRNWANSIPT